MIASIALAVALSGMIQHPLSTQNFLESCSRKPSGMHYISINDKQEARKSWHPMLCIPPVYFYIRNSEALSYLLLCRNTKALY